MRKHEIEVPLDGTPEQAWDAVSKAEELTSWFAPEVRVEPGEGGKIMMSWGPGFEGEAPIRVWEPGKRIAWVEGAGSEHPKIIEFQIEAVEGGKAVLRLVHSGFGDGANFDSEFDSVHGGWHTFFGMLRYKIARFPGAVARNVFVMNMSKQPRLETWERFQKLTGITSTAEGTDYTAQIGPLSLQGQVWRTPKAGYVCLSVSSLSDSLLGVFIEGGGPQAIVSFQWILYGEDSIARNQEPVRAAIEALCKELCDPS